MTIPFEPNRFRTAADLPRLVAAVRAALEPDVRDGKIAEVVEAEALLGFRR